MREIKFRAKNAEVPRCWIYGYFVIEKDCCYIINDDGRFKVIAGTQSQYTGLKDSKGREIYEEDILEFRDGDRKIVKFKDGAFNPIPIEPCNEGHNLGYMYKWGEVIGNIYENPELLSDGNKDEV